MDIIGDILGSMLASGLGGTSRRRRTPAESVTANVGMFVFPLANGSLMLFLELWRFGFALLFLMPVGFSALTYVLCRYAGTSERHTVLTALGSAAVCFVFGGSAFFIGLFFSFFSAL